MISTSGSKLISDAAIDSLIAKLLPLGTIITPNIPEAEVLCGFQVKDETGMIQAAEKLAGRFSGAILVKGGHLLGDAMDLLYESGNTTKHRMEKNAVRVSCRLVPRQIKADFRVCGNRPLSIGGGAQPR